MSIIAGWSRAPRSLLDTTAPSSTSSTTTPAKSAPGQAPSILDQLKGVDAPATPAPAKPK